MIPATVSKTHEDAKWIDHLIGSISDPILCWPGYETDRPPEDIMNAIHLARLLENVVASKEARDPMATDPECSWYLSTASLANVPSEMWTRIYMYCFNQTLHLMHRDVPEGLRQETLSEHDMSELKHLKVWMYERRTKYRHEKAKGFKEAEGIIKKTAIREEKLALQPSIFDF